MSAQLWQGKQSIRLDEPVYINGNASVVGKKEGEGPLGLLFDMVGEDDISVATPGKKRKAVFKRMP